MSATDYDSILVEWWEAWGWTPPPKDFLPMDGQGGLIVFDDEVAVCAGFAYTTNSAVGWVEWVISNPTYRKKPDRKHAIEWLIDSLTDACAKAGCKYVYAMIKHKPLIETYSRLGYVKGDTYSTEMIKIIQ